jgi:hypothetical protein
MFFILIRGMRCAVGMPQRQTFQGWIPPKPHGWNQLDTRQPYQAFFFDGTIVHDLALAELTDGIMNGSIQLHDSASMYYCNGQFWCVKYDAIQNQVDDGHHESFASVHGGNTARQADFVDWKLLGFNHGPYNKSTVAVPAARDHLDCERRDQRTWTERIIPQGARAPPERRNITNRYYASLGGDLSLLVGLVVFSAGQAEAGVALRQSIKSLQHGGWWCHGREPGVGCNALPTYNA